MQPNLDRDVLNRIKYIVGSADDVVSACGVRSKQPFSDDVLEYLNFVSRNIMNNPQSRAYSDVITLGFWLRKASLIKLKEKYSRNDDNIRFGRGVAFHIAPSNVPVNFAYSLVAGLLTGNCNIVRVPSKEFPQVDIISDAFRTANEQYPEMKQNVILVRYSRDKEINDVLSGIADTRIVWGGDNTIAELRKSPLPPRSTEVTFADRYSLAVIDSDKYLALDNKAEFAQQFYNDTYFSDQNACTSPRIVIWTGKSIDTAKEKFWNELHQLVKEKYFFQDIQGVNKLSSAYLIAAKEPGIRIENHEDNLVVRVTVPKLTEYLMDLKDNSGYFFEYDCADIMDLVPLCNDKRCQTIGYLGDIENLKPLLYSGIKGIDRVVPIGKTMDFELIWDGYDLIAQLTRIIRL